MKYVLIDDVRGDVFTDEFENKEDAIKKATVDWNGFSEHDKKSRTEFCVIESVNPDEDAEDHLDGDIILDLMVESNE